jgi:uncharacterized RDD family membrane protein YckC
MAQTIEIQTAQQVVLSYDLAPVGLRVLSSFIDLFLQIAMFLAIFIFLGETLMVGWMAFAIFNFYHLLFETFMNGRSPGKMITGIRVMRTDGAALSFSDCFLRWIISPLELTLTAGILALFMALGSERRQRIGDLMAGTVVVSLKYSLHYRFSDLQNLHAGRKDVEVLWPQLRHIEEKHILLIKNLLSSRGNYREIVRQKAVGACANKMSSLLGLAEPPVDHRAFLQQVIDQYIVLTR